MDNMNSVLNEKYGLNPNDIERKSLLSKKFRTLFNFHRIEKKKYKIRWTGTIKKNAGQKKKKLQENLNVGEKVLVLAERIRKKSTPGKFFKKSVQNIVYFNKKQTFIIRTKQKIDKIVYYWLKNSKNNKYLTKRFQRNKLFALKNNFIM